MKFFAKIKVKNHEQTTFVYDIIDVETETETDNTETETYTPQRLNTNRISTYEFIVVKIVALDKKEIALCQDIINSKALTVENINR